MREKEVRRRRRRRRVIQEGEGGRSSGGNEGRKASGERGGEDREIHEIQRQISSVISRVWLLCDGSVRLQRKRGALPIVGPLLALPLASHNTRLPWRQTCLHARSQTHTPTDTSVLYRHRAGTYANPSCYIRRNEMFWWGSKADLECVQWFFSPLLWLVGAKFDLTHTQHRLFSFLREKSVESVSSKLEKCSSSLDKLKMLDIGRFNLVQWNQVKTQRCDFREGKVSGVFSVTSLLHHHFKHCLVNEKRKIFAGFSSFKLCSGILFFSENGLF